MMGITSKVSPLPSSIRRREKGASLSLGKIFLYMFEAQQAPRKEETRRDDFHVLRYFVCKNSIHCRGS